MEYIETVVSIIRHKNKILILKRHPKTKNYPNGWSFVCGRVERGEKPLEAAYREIKEETGLDEKSLNLIKKAKVYMDEDKEIGITWKINPFLFESKINKIKLNKENTNYKWVTIQELLDYNLIHGMVQIAIKLIGRLPSRKGILAIVYKDLDSFVTVKTRNGNITFVSGGIERGESEIQALRHELREEIGLVDEGISINKIPLTHEFTYKKGFLKGVVSRQSVYLVKISEDFKPKPMCDDVIEAKWMSRKEVIENLNFKSLVKIFKKSLEYLNRE
ncbi:MAG: NUDIX hydrolase [Candidatus Aenigmatarchaeota archaeon]